jgi:uncharacterized protein
MEPFYEFPVSITLRVLGYARSDFHDRIVAIFEQQVQETDRRHVGQRFSGGGKYTTVTVQFIAQSKEQLDTLYQELGKEEGVLMVL